MSLNSPAPPARVALSGAGRMSRHHATVTVTVTATVTSRAEAVDVSGPRTVAPQEVAR